MADARPEAWRPMETAPRDGTIVRLLVDYSGDGCHPLEDAEVAQTIGGNTDGNTRDNEGWKFAGWSWEQDCFCEGRGKPIGWLPFAHLDLTDEAGTKVCAICAGTVEAGKCDTCGRTNPPTHDEITDGVIASGKAQPDEDEQWAVDRGADLLEHYAAYIHRVKPDEIEAHPYLPELEQVAKDLRALSKRMSADGVETSAGSQPR